jgi:hypothetical protein
LSKIRGISFNPFGSQWDVHRYDHVAVLINLVKHRANSDL